MGAADRGIVTSPYGVYDSGRLGPGGSARGRLADVDHPVNAERVLEQAEFVAPNASAIASWSAAERYRSAAASHALTRTLNCAYSSRARRDRLTGSPAGCTCRCR